MTKVQIIINPASGMEHPVLRILNKAFGNDVEWDVSVTHKGGDAYRFAEAAVAAGADIVGLWRRRHGYRSASVLVGGNVPLAILPGGTGNAVARMLGIPMELEQSAALLLQNHQLRAIDVGRINNHTFMLRADIGFMAVTGAETPRLEKDRLGKLAYAISGVQHRELLKPIPYYMTLDGEAVEVQGVMCMIINTSAVVFGHRPWAKGISPDDGLLDVLVLTRNDPVALGAAAGSVILGNPTPTHHWQVKTAVIHTDPPQAMSVDGELVENSPAHIQVLPKAVKVIVPLQVSQPDA
jgi:YegS/Rv2252/BmrU family lipid kinase